MFSIITPNLFIIKPKTQQLKNAEKIKNDISKLLLSTSSFDVTIEYMANFVLKVTANYVVIVISLKMCIYR